MLPLALGIGEAEVDPVDLLVLDLCEDVASLVDDWARALLLRHSIPRAVQNFGHRQHPYRLESNRRSRSVVDRDSSKGVKSQEAGEDFTG